MLRKMGQMKKEKEKHQIDKLKYQLKTMKKRNKELKSALEEGDK